MKKKIDPKLNKNIIFFIIFIIFFYIINPLEIKSYDIKAVVKENRNDYFSIVLKYNKLKKQIAEKSLSLKEITDKITELKEKNSVMKNWFYDYKISSLLKKSYEISLKLNKLKHNLSTFKLLKENSFVFYINSINKYITYLLDKKNEKNINEIIMLTKEKDNILKDKVWLENNFNDYDVYGIKKVMTDKNEDVFVKYNLCDDLITEIRIKENQKIKNLIFLKKEIDITLKMKYYTKNNKIIMDRLKYMGEMKKKLENQIIIYNNQKKIVMEYKNKLKAYVMK